MWRQNVCGGQGFAVVPLQTQHHDESITKTQAWLHDNFQQTFRFEDLAGRMGMSLRTLARRFKAATGDSPLGYRQKLRVAMARRLLEHDDRTVQGISHAVGYDDVAFFRDLFQRHTGASPPAYRQRCGR